MSYSDATDEMKASILGATVAAIGFLFAFWTASQANRASALNNLRNDSAIAVGQFFGGLGKDFTEVELFLDELAEAFCEVSTNGSYPTWERLAQRSNAIQQARLRISAATSEVYRLLSSHEQVLRATPAAYLVAKLARKSLLKASEDLWKFLLPLNCPNEGHFVAWMLNVGPDQWKTFSRNADYHSSMMAGYAQGAVAALRAPIVPPTFGLVMQYWENRGVLAAMYAHRKKARNDA